MLSFSYTMELSFSGCGAREHAFTLRCLPQETKAQRICDFSLQIMPETPLSYSVDAFGNRCCYGLVHERHEKFLVQAEGTAEYFPQQYEPASQPQEMLFRQFTDKTRPGPALTALLRSLPTPPDAFGGDTLRLVQELRRLVNGTMTYTPGSTTPDTSAEEAAAAGQGVCQDYVHIFLALCRLCRIPCRYAAGLLRGTGKSHAWAEAAIGGRWFDMDPTNPEAPREDHLVFSYGRDAVDCEINRGVYLGSPAQRQEITALLQDCPENVTRRGTD